MPHANTSPHSLWLRAAVKSLVSCVSLFCCLSGSLASADDGAKIDYLRDVRPLLGDRCFRCHGPDENSREGGLRLDQAEAALTGGDSGAAVVPFEPEQSEMIRRLLTEVDDERMPPESAKQPLSDAEKQLLVDWVKQGAEYADHWAFGPVTRPMIGQVDQVGEIQRADFAADNSIDAWVMQGWSNEIQRAPTAERYRLARRAALDLTGLPPDLFEVDRFASDPRPDAWVRYVDRLLASPRYGERWAWPWLDAARYADSNGYQGDGDRTMWPWRDWVVDALNRGMPFDQWTIWQVAGDQVPDANDESRLASGFLRNHMINGEGGRIPEENRVDYVFDMNETVGTTWLAITLNCARCHDHKFDPISRRDYYQLSAFFNQTPVDGSGGNAQTPPVMTITTDEQQRLLDRLAEPIAKLVDELAQAEAASQAANETNAAGQESAPASIAPRDRNKEQWRTILEARDRSEVELGKIEQLVALMTQRDQIYSQRPVVMIMADRPERRPTYLLDKGLYTAVEDEVSAGVPEVLGPWPEGAPDNRYGLARWLIESARPLTARVAVNRIWQELYGIGIVKTAEDFGTQGEPPANAALLDGLAFELIDHQWDTKWLVRQLVVSSTYRLDSVRSGSLEEWDPANRLAARGARYRMPSWMIRDQALAIAQVLETRIGGPPVHPYQPDGVWQEATFGARGYPQGRGADLHRRSLYTFWRRIVAPTMFFDSASRQTCSVAVARTNTPLQALVTLNDPTFMEAARLTADQLLIEIGNDDPSAWVEALMRRVLIRPASPQEQQIVTAAYLRHQQHFVEHPEQAEALLNFGETPSPKPASEYAPASRAALTLVVSTLLNLDETLSKE